ncbi:Rossmann-fold NAD(P)-binding domain-containing protein [Flindersiella endophytica]
MTSVPDVVVVGAGPAGLVVGRMLQRAGVSFTLLERRTRAELSSHPKAGLVEYRTVQVLTAVGIAGADLRFGKQNGRMEFRTPGRSAIFDYGSLTGGRPNYVYPQHQLVGELCDVLIADGADLRFGQAVTGVRQGPDGAVVVLANGEEIACQAVVGCDGARSVVASAMPGVQVSEEVLGVRLMAVLAGAPPMVDHTIYAIHPRGFAGQMRRGDHETRYYLEVPATDSQQDWPEEQIRAELSLRLDVDGKLADVPFGTPSWVDLRVRVLDPIQQGRFYLAGDAAHLITPAGGKGMNLAIQDAVELAAGLVARFGPSGDSRRLDAYSRTRLPVIWRTQAFSLWYLRVLLAGLRNGSEAPAAVPGGFTRGLGDGWIDTLLADPLLARWFAYAYAGVDVD